MKKFLMICAIMLAAVTGYANSDNTLSEVVRESVYAEGDDGTKVSPVSYSIDLGDVTNKSDEEIEKRIESIFDNILTDSEEKCSLKLSATIVKDELNYKISIKCSGKAKTVREQAKDMFIGLIPISKNTDE